MVAGIQTLVLKIAHKVFLTTDPEHRLETVHTLHMRMCVRGGVYHEIKKRAHERGGSNLKGGRKWTICDKKEVGIYLWAKRKPGAEEWGMGGNGGL